MCVVEVIASEIVRTRLGDASGAICIAGDASLLFLEKNVGDFLRIFQQTRVGQVIILST